MVRTSSGVKLHNLSSGNTVLKPWRSAYSCARTPRTSAQSTVLPHTHL